VFSQETHFALLGKPAVAPFLKHVLSAEGEHVWKKEVLERNIETSLQRLRTDHVDILQFHGGDAQTLQRERLIDAVMDFRDQGMIKFVGASSRLPHLPALINLGVFDTFQIPYSCLAPQHHDLITRAAETGAGIIIRGGIAQGGPDAEIQRPALNDIWTGSTNRSGALVVSWAGSRARMAHGGRKSTGPPGVIPH